MADKLKSGFFEKLTPVLLLVTVGLAFMVGVLWQKVASIEKGNVNVNPTTAQQAPQDLSGKLSADQAKKLPPISDADHIRGSKNAQVILIEYSDLQCPYCDQFHPTMQKAVKEYGDKLAWVYRQFPLDTIHPRALPAANASECVSNLGGNDAFWKFVDTIFSDQQTYLTDSGLKSAASKAGVSASGFSSCFSQNKFKDVVSKDYQGGVDAGVTGTPGNYVINKKGEVWVVPGAVPFDQLKTTIDEALKS